MSSVWAWVAWAGVLVGMTAAWLVLQRRPGLLLPRHHKEADDFERPQIARIRVVRVPCRLCARGLEENDLVVWFEKTNGGRSMPAHAACAVLIKKPDGSIERLGGEGVAATWRPGYLLLTEEEWEHWNKQVPVEMGVVSRYGKDSAG